jgi:hypothetical protein
MNIYIVVTINEGDPDTYADIIDVFKKEKDAQALVKKIANTTSQTKLENFGCITPFDSVEYVKANVK